jgi:hypothetical protein
MIGGLSISPNLEAGNYPVFESNPQLNEFTLGLVENRDSVYELRNVVSELNCAQKNLELLQVHSLVDYCYPEIVKSSIIPTGSSFLLYGLNVVENGGRYSIENFVPTLEYEQETYEIGGKYSLSSVEILFLSSQNGLSRGSIFSSDSPNENKNYLEITKGLVEKLTQDNRLKTRELEQKLNLINTRIRKELAPRSDLTASEFDGLRAAVRNYSDFEEVINLRGIVYPNDGTTKFDESDLRVYGSPLSTHNLGYGLCDELALYFTSFFWKRDLQLYLMRSGDYSGVRDFLGHAFVIINKDADWDYITNNDIFEGFDSGTEALYEEIIIYPVIEDVFFVGYLLGGQEGNQWMYDDSMSEDFANKILRRQKDFFSYLKD